MEKLTYEELEQRIKALEKELLKRKQAEKALRESKEKLAGIIASMAEHMSMMDEQYNIVWANDVAKRLFGPNLVGKKCYHIYYGYDKPCEPCVVRKCFEDGKVHEHETDVIGADGVGILQDGKLVFANAALASILGYTVEHLVGIEPIALFRDDDKQRFKELLEALEPQKRAHSLQLAAGSFNIFWDITN